ncbi:MAG: hypothetical protein FWD97_10025 [Defluviitaleaceae bacterium]|nr:hypothetical protein [Defluviitaleaceae bacterium]
MKVIQIKIYPEKGSAGERLIQAQFVAGEGIAGDRHNNVSLMTETARKFAEKNPEGMCMAKFKANLLVEGDLSDNEILKITGGKKFCFEECTIFSTECPFGEGVGFAEVVKNGVISVKR